MVLAPQLQQSLALLQAPTLELKALVEQELQQNPVLEEIIGEEMEVREKKWHASQQLRELKKGGVELRLKLSSLMEVQRWVLSWGGDAVVVKPRELAESVQAAAQMILRR